MDKNFDFIKGYLNYYRNLEKKKSIKEDIFLFSSIFFLSFILINSIGNILFFTPAVRNLIKILFFLISITPLLKIFIDFIFWKKQSFERLAILMEKKLPLGNHLINSWQLTVNGKSYPDSFIKKLREKTVELIKGIDPSSAVEYRRCNLYKKISIFSLFSFFLYAFLSPSSFYKGFRNIFFPPVNEIIVEPGNCTVEKGKPLKIRVYTEKEEPVYILISGLGKSSLEKEGNFFSYYIPEVNEDFRYMIMCGNTGTDWFYVKVVDETVIKKLIIWHIYPPYTGKKNRKEEKDSLNIRTLYGTKIKLKAVFNNFVGDTYMIFSNGKILKDGGKSERKSFQFFVKEPVLFQFRYYDFLRRSYKKTDIGKIEVIYDSAPFVEFKNPGKDLKVSGGERIPLSVKASDDFGLKKLRIRIHKGEGEISENDDVIYEIDINGKKEIEVNTVLELPEKLNEVISYYAECLDNCNPSNIGRSSIYYIYPSKSWKYGKEEMGEEKDGKVEKLNKIKKNMEQFIKEEKMIIEAAKRMEKVKDFSGKEELDKLAESQNKWAEILKKMVNDLDKIGSQTKGKFNLLDEFVEMISHVESSESNLKKGDVHMAVSEAQIGLELAEEITSNLERWLSEFPDYRKWELEEPSKEYEVPEAELPSELEDIIGELIEQEEDMREEIEDLTSSWMDSLDKGAGWTVMDGPISNMSAKGITGNLMPNQQEIGGRSGEGRTGRSYGEMVEKTATGKGGRKTPARLTPDNLEPGKIDDKSGQNPLGPTGGGKLSGWGSEGLRGVSSDFTFKYDILSKKQKELIEKAEKLIRSLKVLNIYNPQLEKAISSMKKFQIQLKEGRYEELLKTKYIIISQLKQAYNTLVKKSIIKEKSFSKYPKEEKEMGSIWEEEIPPGYEKIVIRYWKMSMGK